MSHSPFLEEDTGRMFLRACVVLCIALCLAEAEYTSFNWRSCTTDKANQALKVYSASAHPMPVLTPGNLHISFSAEVLRQIEPGAVLSFDITRHTSLGLDAHIPCVGGIGSCVLDGCSVVDTLINGTRQGQRDLGNQLKKMFESVGIFTSCPIAVQNVTITNYAIHIGDLDPALNVIADGDYTIRTTVLQPSTGVQFGCFEFDATLKRKSTPGQGWLLGRRRRRSN